MIVFLSCTIFILCFHSAVANYDLLQKISAFDYDAHRDDNGELSLSACPTDKITETIKPCGPYSGSFSIHAYPKNAVLNKQMSFDGRDVKMRLSKQTIWEIHPIQSSELNPFYIEHEGYYLGAGRRIMGNYGRLQMHHKYVSWSHDSTNAILYAPWCGVTTGAVYLQAVGSNFWLSKSEFGDHLIYKANKCPPTAFTLVSENFKNH